MVFQQLNECWRQPLLILLQRQNQQVSQDPENIDQGHIKTNNKNFFTTPNKVS